MLSFLLSLLMQISSCSRHHNVLLTWQADSDSTVTLYNIYRATQTGGPYTLIGNTSGLSFVDSNVSDNITYFWCITAVNSNGESVLSPETNAQIVP